MATEYEEGTCSYIVVYEVFFRTSGTELPGKDEYQDKFPTERLAAEWIVNHEYEFSRTNWGSWRAKGGYTSASIRRKVKYDYQ